MLKLLQFLGEKAIVNIKFREYWVKICAATQRMAEECCDLFFAISSS